MKKQIAENILLNDLINENVEKYKLKNNGNDILVDKANRHVPNWI